MIIFTIFKYSYFIFIGFRCRIYTAFVTSFFNGKTPYTEELESFKCYSSWSKRNDLSYLANVTGTTPYAGHYYSDANDGFFCPSFNGYNYHNSAGTIPWLRFDLQSYFNIKCVRISSAQNKFDDVEIRFGNFSDINQWELNLLLGSSGTAQFNSFAEICVNYDLIGRYIFFKHYVIEQAAMNVGEVQITV